MQRAAIGTAILLLLGALAVLLNSISESGESGPENASTAGAASSKSGTPSAGGPPGKAIRSDRQSHSRSRVVFSGPNNLEEWDQTIPEGESEPAWEYSDGVLISTRGGAIAREVPLPTQAKIAFKLAWNNTLRFRFLLFADQDTTQPDNCYDLVIQRRFAYLRKRWRTNASGGSRIIGQANIAALAEGEEALFEFYISRNKGTFAFFVDGVRQVVWNDTDPDVGLFGNWLQFISEDYYPIEVSELTAERWEGERLPDAGDRLPEDYDPPDPSWVEKLIPPGPWAPVERLRRERRDIRVRLQTALANAEGPARNAATHAAQREAVEAQQRYESVLALVPFAKLHHELPGHVINPFTGAALDVRGVPSGTRIWDPRSGRSDQTFRVP